MPRKKVIIRKVRRLTPREMDYLATCTASHDAVYWEAPDQWTNYENESRNLLGMFKHLAIIEEGEK
jgi:sarcosine oxidase gamma subunit